VSSAIRRSHGWATAGMVRHRPDSACRRRFHEAGFPSRQRQHVEQLTVLPQTRSWSGRPNASSAMRVRRNHRSMKAFDGGLDRTSNYGEPGAIVRLRPVARIAVVGPWAPSPEVPAPRLACGHDQRAVHRHRPRGRGPRPLAGALPGHAEFYREPVTDEQLDRVWSWLTDPEHDVKALLVRDGAARAVRLAHYRPYFRPLAATVAGHGWSPQAS
jgi:hypothetical protein